MSESLNFNSNIHGVIDDFDCLWSSNVCQCNNGNSYVKSKGDRCMICGYRWFDVPIRDSHARDIHGMLKFANELDGDSEYFPFIAVSPNAESKQLIRWININWGFGDPNLVISLLGGGKFSSNIESSMKQYIVNGINASVNEHSWLITSGLNSDWLSKSAANSMVLHSWNSTQKKRCKCIGFAAFGDVDLHENIYVQYYKGIRKIRYKVRNNPEEGMFSLNDDHNAFIFVDSGKRHNLMDTWHLRESFHRNLQLSKYSESSLRAPLVVLLVGGALYNLDLIVNSSESGVPIIVCDGTGGCADVISFAMKNYVLTQENVKCFNKDNQKDIYALVRDRFRKNELTLKEEEIFSKLYRCLDNKFIQIVDTSSRNVLELDRVILQSILRYYSHLRDPLELTLRWNRADIAYSHVLPNIEVRLHPQVDKFMLHIIKEQKIEFLELFLDSGFIMKKFLTVEVLLDLYNHAAKINNILGWILEKRCKNKKTTKLYNLSDFTALLRELTGSHTASSVSSEGTQLDDFADDSKHTFDFPFVELAMWSVLANNMDMALFFWSKAKESILLALILSKLWRSLSLRLWHGEDVYAPQFQDNAKLFENLAVGVVDVCYITDRILAKNVLKKKCTIWKDSSSLEVAFDGKCKNFLSTTCAQAVIESQWKNNMLCSLFGAIYRIAIPFGLLSLEISPSEDLETEAEIKADDNMYSETMFDCDQNINCEFFPPANGNSSAMNSLRDLKRKLIVFYTAPITKFVSHSLSYILLLVLHAWMVLNFEHKYVNYAEYGIFMLVFSYSIEELRQLISTARPWQLKLNAYFQSEWNIIDVMYLSLIYVSFIIRYYENQPISSILQALVALLLWIRMLRMYHSVASLGPIWITIRKMFKEMVIFLSIFWVVLLAYGVSSSFLFHGDKLNDLTLFKVFQTITLSPLLIICLASEDLDEVIASDQLLIYKYIYAWLLAAFIMIGNVLFLNLLIAIFRHIYLGVKKNARIEWKYEMYSLCREYSERTILPPPFSAIETIVRLVQYLCCDEKLEKPYSLKFLEKLQLFESYCQRKYLVEKKLRVTEEDRYSNLRQFSDEEKNLIITVQKLATRLKRDLRSATSSQFCKNKL